MIYLLSSLVVVSVVLAGFILRSLLKKQRLADSGLKLVERLLARREQREQALLEVLELSKQGNVLGCVALEVAIDIKFPPFQYWKTRYKPGQRVFSGSTFDMLGDIRNKILELAKNGSFFHDPYYSGELIAQLVTLSGPTQQKELMSEILSIGQDDQLQAFQFIGTDLQATTLVAQAYPNQQARLEYESAKLNYAILKKAGPLMNAYGWK